MKSLAIRRNGDAASRDGDATSGVASIGVLMNGVPKPAAAARRC
jgi:hypothetical protein